MNDHQRKHVRLRLEHHYGATMDTIPQCEAELSRCDYRDAIAAIDRLAMDPKVFKPTPARLRQAHRWVMAQRIEREKATKRAQQAFREQEQADAYWRLANRARTALRHFTDAQCREIMDDALADQPWMALPYGAQWFAERMRECGGSARSMLEGPMVAVLIDRMIGAGEVDDTEGALERASEEIEAARCSDALLARGFESLAKSGGSPSGDAAEMRA